MPTTTATEAQLDTIAFVLDALVRYGVDSIDLAQNGPDIYIDGRCPLSPLVIVRIATRYGMRVDLADADDPVSVYRLSF